jgi:DNA-binding MarR family transcriptional regulator
VTDPTPWEQVEALLPALLSRATRMSLYGQVLAGAGLDLDPALYPVLACLERSGPAAVGTVAAELGVDRSTMSRHALQLEGAGLASRTVAVTDRRLTVITLTPAGRRMAARLRSRLVSRLADQTAGWPPEDALRFAELFERFVLGMAPGPGPADGRD